MRASWLALGGLVLLATPLWAQQGFQPQNQAQTPPGFQPQNQAAAQQQQVAPLDPNNKLDAVLMQWEAKMLQVQTLHARVIREQIDYVHRDKTIFEGQAKYSKPNFALLELRQQNKPERIEKYICSGTFLYEFNVPNKQVRVHELPPPKPGQVADDNFLTFLFGMKAQEAKTRYDMTYVGDDQFYYYLRVLPRRQEDKADFKEAQLAITRSTFLPAMLTFHEPSGNIITWQIPVIQNGAQIDRREFQQPTLPDGWKWYKVPREMEARQQRPDPRVVRPQAGGK